MMANICRAQIAEIERKNRCMEEYLTRKKRNDKIAIILSIIFVIVFVLFYVISEFVK